MKILFLFCSLLLTSNLLANPTIKIDEYINSRSYKEKDRSLKGAEYDEAWISYDYGSWVHLYIFKDKAKKKIVQIRQECTLCRSSKIEKNVFFNSCKTEQESLQSFLTNFPMKKELEKELYFFAQMDRNLKTENKTFTTDLGPGLRKIRVTRATAYCDARDGYYLAVDYFF